MIKTECLFWLKDPHEVSYFVRNVEMWQNGIKCNIKTLLKCKFNVKNGESLRDQSSQRLMIKCLTIIQIELEFGNVGFRGGEKQGEPGENPLRAIKRSNNKLNPHFTPGTWATLVEGECSHHCVIPAPRGCYRSVVFRQSCWVIFCRKKWNYTPRKSV